MDEHDLEATLKQAPVGFAAVRGPGMVFTIANSRYLEMVSRTDIVGRAWVDVFPELVDSPTHAAVRSVYEGQSIHVQEFPVLLHRNGTMVDGFYSFTLEPTFDAAKNVIGMRVPKRG